MARLAMTDTSPPDDWSRSTRLEVEPGGEATPPHGVPPVRRDAAPDGRAAGRARQARGDARARGRGLRGPGSAGAVASDAGAAASDIATLVPASRASLAGGEEAGPTPLPDAVRVTREHRHRAAPRGRVYESGGRRRRHRLTRRGGLLLALLVVAAVLAGLAAWYETAANPSGKPGRAVVVHVRPGESFGTIAASLSGDGVIGTAAAFHLWELVHGAPIVRSGDYELHRNISFSALAADLQAGPNVYEVVVAPGNTLSEIASQLASLPGNLAQSFANEARTGRVRSPYQTSPGATLEGLIAPGTYEVRPHESAKALLTAMVARFDKEAAAAGLSPSTTVAGLNAYQIVTLASIAQKEGYFNRYIGDVARVIYNRLGAGMRLDMTSTVLYSLGKDGGPVTAQEEQLTTPYNTYLNAGLTPTPICTPSEEALRAAVAPPQGQWLYFELVTKTKGVTVFSSTYTQQLQAEQEAAANAAKSAAGSGSGTPSPGS